MEEDLKQQHDNELDQREMVFIYPSLKYETYRIDLKLLNEIGKDNK